MIQGDPSSGESSQTGETPAQSSPINFLNDEEDLFEDSVLEQNGGLLLQKLRYQTLENKDTTFGSVNSTFRDTHGSIMAAQKGSN